MAAVPVGEPAVEQLAPLGEGARALLPEREEGGCVRAAGAHAATCEEEVAATPWGSCSAGADDDSGWSFGGGFALHLPISALHLPIARCAACTDACCAASTCVCCVSARLVTYETQLW